MHFSTFEIFVFSALISAVDPVRKSPSVTDKLCSRKLHRSQTRNIIQVAVIAVFEDLHVNGNCGSIPFLSLSEFLFVNVFGEALFNDGVTVVLYQISTSFALIGYDGLDPGDYVKAGFSFFLVALGGTLIGIIFAFLTSLATKYTYSNSVRILAPVFIFVLPYIAYLAAEMISLSSIIA